MTRGRLILKFCKWFENTRFKILRQRDELHLSDNPTGTALADLVGDNSVGATHVPVISTTRDHPPPVQSASFGEGWSLAQSTPQPGGRYPQSPFSP